MPTIQMTKKARHAAIELAVRYAAYMEHEHALRAAIENGALQAEKSHRASRAVWAGMLADTQRAMGVELVAFAFLDVEREE